MDSTTTSSDGALTAVPDELSAGYWSAAARHELSIQRCGACGRLHHPPQRRCDGCGGSDLGWAAVSGRGAIYSWCVVSSQAVAGYIAPYVVASVALAEQSDLIVASSWHEHEMPHIGQEVHARFRDVGGMTLPYFGSVRP